MSREEIKKLFIAGAVFAGALAYLISNHILDTAQAIESTILFALVLVTVTYAKRTAVMAEEMKKQRIMASQPVIIQKAVYEKDIYEGSTRDYFSHFEISNVGNGPAIEVEISLIEKEESRSHSIRQTFLRTDDPPIKFRPYNIANLKENTTYYLVCEYQSTLSSGPRKTLYRTRLPFKPAKSSKEGKIYLVAGELEFYEVSKKDRIDAFNSRSKPK